MPHLKLNTLVLILLLLSQYIDIGTFSQHIHNNRKKKLEEIFDNNDLKTR
jgi:hypothetical protein